MAAGFDTADNHRLLNHRRLKLYTPSTRVAGVGGGSLTLPRLND